MNSKRPMPYNAKRRRSRKATIAARDGARCTYCFRPFADLKDATMDHVVPYALLPTWSTAHLVLACRRCNNAKADRLPLTVALLALWSTDREEPSGAVHAPTAERVHEQSTRGVRERSGERVGRPDSGVFTVDWRWLGRLAHARLSADRPGPVVPLTAPTGGVDPSAITWGVTA